MFIVGFLGWWYGAGWRTRLRKIGARIMSVFDVFSIDLLIKTWLAPFRQIGAGQTGRGLSEQLRVLFDALVSRAIGGAVRTITIGIGLIVVTVMAIAGILEGILWLFVPLLPVVGVILFAIGWVPYEGL